MVISPCPLMMKQHRSFEIQIWVEIYNISIDSSWQSLDYCGEIKNMFKFSAALNQNLRIWSVSLKTILRSTLAHITNLALLHRKQNNHIHDHTLAGAACSDGMSISTNRYRKIAKQMRLCRVKIPDSTGRTGIICSSRPAKKPLLASNSSPHHQWNVAEEIELSLIHI